MAKCHVVAMPYPAWGHINPMMSLCTLLAKRSSHIHVTVVVTEKWLGSIGSETKPANLSFATIRNVLPSDLAGFVEAVETKMEEPFEVVLDRLESPASVIVADTFLPWAVDVGNQRNIPVASFWPMPASVFSIFHHFELLVKNGHFPVELTERGEERVDYIPGLSPIRLADLPSIIHMKVQAPLHGTLQQISKVTKAQYLLFSSIFELESLVINGLEPQFPFPIYSLGPVIPYFNVDRSSPHTASPIDTDGYLEWLDSQPPGSVLYVSMGTFLSVSSDQMDEIVYGLRDSSVRYLLVAREKASRLKERCGEAGMVVSWCDQLKVLCHSSVGGFWTHCGWNSTMESLFAGVPLLCLPLVMDQVPISKLIVEDWKIGWKVKEDAEIHTLLRMHTLVRREEIGELVRRFMDSKTGERKEMVKRAREMREICQRAIGKGGSTDVNFDAFVKDISK